MKILLLPVLFLLFINVAAQTTDKNTSLSLIEYEKAKSFTISDLDKDTYAKFENTYLLDRYEMRKPYLITGDDGLKKRIDLYKLIRKDGMQDLGTMVFYTNEKGKMYTALQPSFNADAAVWNKYFTDIDNINKEEKNFVLKLSYVLSKELSFQLYKAMHQGKDLSEMATYGTDICFPGDQQVTMANGSVKQISSVQPGDEVITVDPVTRKTVKATVSQLVQHEAHNYAITRLLAIAAKESVTSRGYEVWLSDKVLAATPNHPITTDHLTKMADVSIGDKVVCLDEGTHQYRSYTVVNKTESADGVQKVYNMVTAVGTTFIMNGVMVMQKN